MYCNLKFQFFFFIIIMKDYYMILNVSKDCDIDTLKKKFKKRIMKYHPDKNNNDPVKTKKFKLVSEAYNVLSDPYKRGRYDVEYEKQNKKNNLFDISNNFINMDDLLKNMPKGKMKSYSYSSSKINNNGDIVERQKVSSNLNGVKKNYYKKIVTDKNGNKKIVKEKGDKSLLSNSSNMLFLDDKKNY